MRHSKKLAALALAAGVTLTATAAFAYWTADGSGGGGASAKEDISLTLTGDAVTNLVPGVPQDITGTVYVSDGVADAWVGTVTPSIDENPEDGDAATVWQPGCSADDFELLPFEHNALIDDEENVAFGSIELRNLARNQDDCKNQALVLNFSNN